MKDIEIANQIEGKPILEIAKELGIENNIELYGNKKAKIQFNKIRKEEKGKVILVTAINPTPYGEGKTTVSIGLNDALRMLQKNSIAVLREPSLGPVFGVKGGATGGGYAQVIPMEDINLHFTGDFHAITSANNLISAAIENHLYFGNEKRIDKQRISFRRCLDVNDRALRKVFLNEREETFNITAASEIMSILCLSTDFTDLKRRLSNILLAYDVDGSPIYTKDLKLEGALATILKDAIKPNLVQSLEQNPVIIHGGPFANIAHGCNSIIATKLGRKLSDYVITEAGFGSDLGAEKFLDIKCRTAHLAPDAIIIVATTKALKHHGGANKDNLENNVEMLKKGLSNLEVHIENMLQYTNNVIVTLNQYTTDTQEEIEAIQTYVESKNIPFTISNSYSQGGKGSLELAQKVIETTNQEHSFTLLYPDQISIFDKVETIAKKIYHANHIEYSTKAKEKIQKMIDLGYTNYPVCIAKTQYSISDNSALLGYPKDYTITVTDANIYTGAEFIVIYLGSIMTMPGLSKHPNYEKITINDEFQIEGLF